VSGGLRQRYADEAVPALQKQFNYINRMQIRACPRSSSTSAWASSDEPQGGRCRRRRPRRDHRPASGDHQGEALDRAIPAAHRQHDRRAGDLRGDRMWDFLERLTRIALCPASATFTAWPAKSFDAGAANYSLGLSGALAFPEIDYDKVDRLRGLEISIVTTAKTDEESKRCSNSSRMPFAG